MKRFNSILAVMLVCAAALTVAPLASAQTFADTVINLPAGACPGSGSANFVALAAAGAGTGLNVVGTASTPVYQVATSAAATHTYSCDFACPTRTTVGKGCTAIAGFVWFYGIVTTTATSMTTPACVTALFPAPAASETASVAAGTAVPSTPIPAVASANLTAVTTGQFYSQYVAITTPNALPSAAGTIYQKMWCTFAIGQTGASAMQTNTPGGLIFTTNTISWLKKHRHGVAVDAMVKQGISPVTAELIYGHYAAKKSLTRKPA